jgi:hypothetical protein
MSAVRFTPLSFGLSAKGESHIALFELQNGNGHTGSAAPIRTASESLGFRTNPSGEKEN